MSMSQVNVAWSGSDEVFRVVLELDRETEQTVEELGCRLSGEIFDGRRVTKLFAVGAQGLKVTLRPSQKLFGLLAPTDSLFATVDSESHESSELMQVAPEDVTAPPSNLSSDNIRSHESLELMQVAPEDVTAPPSNLSSDNISGIRVKVILHDAHAHEESDRTDCQGFVELVIPLDVSSSSLVTLKHEISKELNLKSFAPDMDADQIANGNVTVTLNLGGSLKVVSLHPDEPLSTLREQLSKALLVGSQENLQASDIHYILINGTRLVELHTPSDFFLRSSAQKPTTVRDLVELQMQPTDQLHLFGPGLRSGEADGKTCSLFPISGLETFQVTVTVKDVTSVSSSRAISSASASGSTSSPLSFSTAVALCVASSTIPSVDIKNPLLASTTSEGVQTVLTLKQALFDKFFAKHHCTGVDPRDIVVTMNGEDLLDTASLESAGVGSLSTVEISCPAFEAWAAAAMRPVSVHLSGPRPYFPFAGEPSPLASLHSVPVLPYDSIAVLAYRLDAQLAQEGAAAAAAAATAAATATATAAATTATTATTATATTTTTTATTAAAATTTTTATTTT